MVIALCGYMGAGKSTIGNLLGKKLRYNHIDIDELITSELGCSISEIFDTRGEDYFRELETKTIKRLNNISNSIISLGGGACINPENIEIIKSFATLVYLRVPFEDCYTRIIRRDTRPIVKTKTKDELAEHYKDRTRIYENVCDIVIDSTSVDDTLEKIIKIIKG